MASVPIHITLIGAGNVGYHLARRLATLPVIVDCVFSRTIDHATEVAALTGSVPATSPTEIPGESDFYIITLADQAAEEFINKFRPKKGTVVHTSGSLEMDILQITGRPYGVLYPLQTFSRARMIDFSGFPVCTEGCDPATLRRIDILARLLSDDIRHTDSDQRRQIHLAAVFACNFSNYMYVIAADILRKYNLPFDIMLPLIREFFSKLNLMAPWEAQTGPAIRGDENIIQKHIEMLHDSGGYDELYRMISELITKRRLNNLP